MVATVSPSFYFGFHTTKTCKNEFPTHNNAKGNNVGNILGYIPVIGILIGAVRIDTARRENLSMATKVTMIVRGILEIMGLGLLFLIPDLIVSIGRHLCHCTHREQPDW